MDTSWFWKLVFLSNMLSPKLGLMPFHLFSLVFLVVQWFSPTKVDMCVCVSVFVWRICSNYTGAARCWKCYPSIIAKLRWVLHKHTCRRGTILRHIKEARGEIWLHSVAFVYLFAFSVSDTRAPLPFRLKVSPPAYLFAQLANDERRAGILGKSDAPTSLNVASAFNV